MRFFFKALLLLPLVLSISQNLRAQDYAVEELSDKNAASARPFSISSVERADPGLRLFIATDNPDGVAALLASGRLLAQLSDHQAETETVVPLSFNKAVWCSEESQPVYLAYSDLLSSCNDKPPVRIEYFFEVPAVLGPGRDLAIGQDPDFLWLVEER
jgi:hypothetical protein